MTISLMGLLSSCSYPFEQVSLKRSKPKSCSKQTRTGKLRSGVRLVARARLRIARGNVAVELKTCSAVAPFVFAPIRERNVGSRAQRLLNV
jgi:hypothetical protein